MVIQNLNYIETAEDISIKGSVGFSINNFSLLGLGPTIAGVTSLSTATSADLAGFILPSLDISVAPAFAAGNGLLGFGILGGGGAFAS